MKKLILNYLLVLIMVTMSLFLLASCKHQHIYGEWETEIPPTCTETGNRVRICECGKKETESIAATGHSNVEWIIDVEATCTETGSKHQACAICATTIKTEVIDATGHADGEWFVSVASTCTSEGLEHMNCSICGQKIKERKINKISHNYSNGECQYCHAEQPISTGLAFTTLGDGTCYVDGIGTCTDADILIPPISPDGDTVIGIGYQAFYYNKKIISVSLPNTIIAIDSYAFQSCSKLKKIELPDSLTFIGYDAFSYCDSLMEITIPSSVTTIKDGALSGCFALSNIKVHENNSEYKSIDGNLYSKDRKTLLQYAIGKTDEEFMIPHGVTSIKKCAFSFSVNLTNIIIPSSVEMIEEGTFASYNLITHIEVDSENITYKSLEGNLYSKDGSTLIQYAIGKKAHDFTIPDNVVCIAKYAFAGAENLVSVVISNGVTTISENAFYTCSNLISVYLGCDVISIGDWAFANCSKLIEIVNNSSLNIQIGTEDFGFIARDAIEVHTGESKIVDLDGYIFYTHDNRNYLLAYIGEETSLILPDSYNDETYEIIYRAFYNNDNIISVIIPSKVTLIGETAFAYCSSLESVTIDDGVSQILSCAFLECKKLKHISISDSVTIIGYRAFSECFCIENLTLPEKLEVIESNAFWGCTGITNVIIYDKVKSIGNDAFDYCLKLTDVYYTGTEEQWKSIVIDTNNNCLINATIHFSYNQN